MNNLQQVQKMVEDLRALRDKAGWPLRSSYNEALDRLDVLASKIDQAGKGIGDEFSTGANSIFPPPIAPGENPIMGVHAWGQCLDFTNRS